MNGVTRISGIDGAYRYPEIRLRNAKVDIEFVSNRVSCIDQVPNSLLLAYPNHLLPWHQNTRRRDDTFYDGKPLMTFANLALRRLEECGEFCEDFIVGHGKLQIEADDSRMRCGCCEALYSR